MKVTLRELFLLATLVAMGCGWWLDRQGLVASYNALREFYETPLVYEAPDTPVDESASTRSVTSEMLTLESEMHQRLIEGLPVQ